MLFIGSFQAVDRHQWDAQIIEPVEQAKQGSLVEDRSCDHGLAVGLVSDFQMIKSVKSMIFTLSISPVNVQNRSYLSDYPSRIFGIKTTILSSAGENN